MGAERGGSASPLESRFYYARLPKPDLDLTPAVVTLVAKWDNRFQRQPGATPRLRGQIGRA
jgi:hypothetical protein